MGKIKGSLRGNYVIRNVLRDYESVLELLNTILKERRVPSRDEMELKRDLFRIRHTLDLSWSSEKFTKEIKKIRWKNVFLTDEEVRSALSDRL